MSIDSAHRVILTIGENHGITAANVARVEGRDKGTVAAIIRRLITQGLVEKKGALLVLTETGRDYVDIETLKPLDRYTLKEVIEQVESGTREAFPFYDYLEVRSKPHPMGSPLLASIMGHMEDLRENDRKRYHLLLSKIDRDRFWRDFNYVFYHVLAGLQKYARAENLRQWPVSMRGGHRAVMLFVEKEVATNYDGEVIPEVTEGYILAMTPAPKGIRTTKGNVKVPIPPGLPR